MTWCPRVSLSSHWGFSQQSHGLGPASVEVDLHSQPAGLIQWPEYLRIPGGIHAAAHLRLPAEGKQFFEHFLELGDGGSRSSFSRRWSLYMRRVTTFTSLHWPKPSVSPSWWSTWTFTRAAPPNHTSFLRAPSQRYTSSISLETRISSTNKTGQACYCPACPPLCQGLDKYRGLFVIANGHILLPVPLPRYNLPHFIKGGYWWWKKKKY